MEVNKPVRLFSGRDPMPMACTVMRKTELAVLVGFEKDGIERWVPLSCIEDEEDDIHSGTEELSIHRWWLEKEGLA